MGTPLAFDENGDVKNAASYIFQVQDDNFVFVPANDEMTTPMATEEASSYGRASVVGAQPAAPPALIAYRQGGASVSPWFTEEIVNASNIEEPIPWIFSSPPCPSN